MNKYLKVSRQKKIGKKRKQWLTSILFWLLSILLAACNQGGKATNTNIPSNTSSPIPTPLPSSTLTRTLVKTTPAPQPSKTATPAKSPAPMFCPDAPDITLKPGDWVMVSKNPPVPNSVRKQPGIGSELSGQIQPGENALVEDGPRCADGYAWWYVRSLKDLEGWTVEGDTASYWLVNPISAWYSLPEPLVARGAQKQQLREISISPDTALVHAINGQYYPLATPLPTPRTIETPFPNDPRGGIEDLQAPAHSAHSSYQISGVIDGSIDIYELEDPLSRYYLNNMSHDDCTQALRDILERDEITPAYLDPFCGVGIGIPLHFIADIRPIDFSGGKGVRFLISSGNYQTVNELYYIFQGLSDDGRYYIRIRFSHIVHPYIIEPQQLSNDFGPVLGWKSGQYEEAQKSYDEFNARIGDLLNAGVVTLYPSLTFLDDAIASMIIN